MINVWQWNTNSWQLTFSFMSFTVLLEWWSKKYFAPCAVILFCWRFNLINVWRKSEKIGEQMTISEGYWPYFVQENSRSLLHHHLRYDSWLDQVEWLSMKRHVERSMEKKFTHRICEESIGEMYCSLISYRIFLKIDCLQCLDGKYNR